MRAHLRQAPAKRLRFAFRSISVLLDAVAHGCASRDAVADSQPPAFVRLQDEERCKLLTAEFDGILLDFSRQRVTGETVRLLEELAKAAGLTDKIAAMAAGKKINVTEDRAVLHMALRAPKGEVSEACRASPASRVESRRLPAASRRLLVTPIR